MSLGLCVLMDRVDCLPAAGTWSSGADRCAAAAGFQTRPVESENERAKCVHHGPTMRWP